MRRALALFAVVVVCAEARAGSYAPDKKAAAAYARAASAQASAQANPYAGDPAAIAAGHAVFESTCAPCHGAAAHGDGPAAVALDPIPADFTDPDRWAATSVGTKHWIAVHGIAGTGMAGVATDDDAWKVLAWLQSTYHPQNGPIAMAPSSR